MTSLEGDSRRYNALAGKNRNRVETVTTTSRPVDNRKTVFVRKPVDGTARLPGTRNGPARSRKHRGVRFAESSYVLRWLRGDSSVSRNASDDGRAFLSARCLLFIRGRARASWTFAIERGNSTTDENRFRTAYNYTGREGGKRQKKTTVDAVLRRGNPARSFFARISFVRYVVNVRLGAQRCPKIILRVSNSIRVPLCVCVCVRGYASNRISRLRTSRRAAMT